MKQHSLYFPEEGLKGEIETSLPIENMAISDQGIVTVLLKNETAPKIISYDAMGNVLSGAAGNCSCNGLSCCDGYV